MNLIEKYFFKKIIIYTAMVLFVIYCIKIFILLLSQINDIGRGDFTIFMALLYVVLNSINEVYVFFPIICMLGCILAFNALNRTGELTVAKASGFSSVNFFRVMVTASLILTLSAVFAGETLGYYLKTYARNMKLNLLKTNDAYSLAWIKKGNVFSKLGINKDTFSFIDFNLGSDFSVILSSGETTNKATYNTTEVMFTKSKILHKSIKTNPIKTESELNLLKNQKIIADNMNLVHLYSMLHVQDLSDSRKIEYLFNFLERVLFPVSSIIMFFLGGAFALL